MLDQPDRLPQAEAMSLPAASGARTQRLAWPAAAAVIVAASVALWLLITMAASGLGLI